MAHRQDPANTLIHSMGNIKQPAAEMGYPWLSSHNAKARSEIPGLFSLGLCCAKLAIHFRDILVQIPLLSICVFRKTEETSDEGFD